MVEILIKNAIEKFNEDIDNKVKDEKLKRELENVTRKVQIEITDDENYNFILCGGKITDFSKGNIEDPDARIISDKATLEGVLKGEIKPIKAWATKKLKVKASLEDMLMLRKFF